MTSRSHIPSDLKRKILVEAGHRCAIPTCRHIQVEIHHIVPWSECQSHEYKNLIALCPNCHSRADRGEIDKKSLISYKNKLRYLHDKFSNFEIDFLFELNKAGNDGFQFPAVMWILVKRILDAGYCCRKGKSSVFVSGMSVSPDMFFITDKGKKFVSDLDDLEQEL